MPRRIGQLFTMGAIVLALTACTSIGDEGRTTPSQSAPSPGSSASSDSGTATGSAPSPDRGAGTAVRFTAGSDAVEVTIGEVNPAVRDFLSQLPMTVTLEEFNGREKIAYPPRALRYEGSPGSDPEDGDLIYFTPWGNLGFYYNAEGIGFSDQTIHLGTFNATREQLDAFDGRAVTIEVVD